MSRKPNATTTRTVKWCLKELKKAADKPGADAWYPEDIIELMLKAEKRGHRRGYNAALSG
jgi:hypothetical protein